MELIRDAGSTSRHVVRESHEQSGDEDADVREKKALLHSHLQVELVPAELQAEDPELWSEARRAFGAWAGLEGGEGEVWYQRSTLQ